MFEMKGSKLLVVDDEPVNTDLLKRIFGKEQCDVLALNGGDKLLETINIYEPDLIILDVMMPGKSGFELTRDIKARAEWQHIPIILLTALMDTESCVTGLEAGAADFVTKPFNLRELRARVSNLIQLKKQGDFLRTHIRTMADYDDITRLPNYKLLGQLAEAMVQDNTRILINFALCQTLSGHHLRQNINANKLKTDESEVYRALVNRMLRHLPENTLVGSLQDGKFGLILCTSEPLAYIYLKAISMALTRPFVFNGKEIHFPFSFGLTPSRFMSPSWNEQLSRAELALSEARKNGRDVVVFESWMDEANGERLRLSQALFGALHEQQFHLCYQPQFDIQKDCFIGFEALLRWTHPEYGAIPPDLFIPLAETNGSIHELGVWVVEAACIALAQWRQISDDIRVAVNVSAVQLQRPGLVDAIENLLERHGLEARHLEIELTESTLANPACDLQIQQFWERGFAISIDDFGTGYSNFGYLKKYPFHRVKIDRSFVQNVCTSNRDVAIVRSVVAMAEHLNFLVIAEGVETTLQLQRLKKLGCHEVQGYLLGKPMTIDKATTLFQTLHNGNGNSEPDTAKAESRNHKSC